MASSYTHGSTRQRQARYNRRMTQDQYITAQPLVFVDVETTGVSAVRGQVIEIAAIRVENGDVVRTVSTLLKPNSRLPAVITRLTGITDADVEDAPVFADIADELTEIFEGAIFVAHNVRFDYGFIKQEFKRIGVDFRTRMLCTVRLSRRLYPSQARHRLADVIAAHQIPVSARHRAYDDAAVLVAFWNIAIDQHGIDAVEQAAKAQLKRPTLPRHLDAGAIDALPQTPGVYVFFDEAKYPLYIGKSIRIRDRVLSHFSSDAEISKEFKIAQSIHSIEVHQTSGELSALLLESQMIKTHMPLHNRRLRRTKKLHVIVREYDPHGYATLEIQTIDAESLPEMADVLGVYARKMSAKESLERTVREHKLCPQLSGIEPRRNGLCFRYQLGSCLGACGGLESILSYNARLEEAFSETTVASWPFDGAVRIIESGHGKQTALIVDRWIVRESIVYDGEHETTTSTASSFDYDTYQIIRSYLIRYKHRLVIEPLQQDI